MIEARIEYADNHRSMSPIQECVSWAKLREKEMRQLKAIGYAVHYQGSAHDFGSKDHDYTVVSKDGKYSLLVDFRVKSNGHSLANCVSEARAAGYVSHRMANDILSGKVVRETRELSKSRIRELARLIDEAIDYLR